MASSSHVFVKDKTYAYLPARLIETKGEEALVDVLQFHDERDIACDGGKKSHRTVKTTVQLKDYDNGVLPLQNSSNAGVLNEVKDMVE